MKIKERKIITIITLLILLIISISASSASEMVEIDSAKNIDSPMVTAESHSLTETIESHSHAETVESHSMSANDNAYPISADENTVNSDDNAYRANDIAANENTAISNENTNDTDSEKGTAIYDADEVKSNDMDHILKDSYMTTIYFNASAKEDGDGSIDNPFQDLKNHQITGRTVYFADGNYTLTRTSYSIGADTILIGQSSIGTIINCSNLGFRVFSKLKLVNLTITDIGLNVTGNLTAEGVIFENCIRVNETATAATDTVSAGYNNTYGGSIHAFRTTNEYTGTSGAKPAVNIKNCTFINSNAVYGGAIYLDAGLASIENTRFINCSSYIYGGAIAAIGDCEVNVTGTSFERCFSADDAGAGIYSRNASLRVIDSNFTDCNATFGSAITQLEKSLFISGCLFENNIARFEGGAIYDMYAPCEIYSSYFINNTAINGGSIFIDTAESFSIILCDFKTNHASGIGGAVFASGIEDLTNSDNLFSKNIAESYPDIYTQDSWGMFYGSEANVIYDSNLSWEGDIPSSYDLRDYGWVSPVKDQMAGGSCWAFAAIAATESATLKASNKTYDFSEENMKNLAVVFSKYGMKSWWGRYVLYPNEGGVNSMAVGYLVSWMGLVNETSDMYDDISDLSYLFNESEIHIQNVYFVPPRQNYTDNDNVKLAILKYGALSTGIYYSGAYLNNKTNYYYYGSNAMTGANHAVTIVGWDDNYPASKFAGRPNGDGAFIVKNSWGPNYGDEGFFYVSYYDTIFTKVGDQDAFAIVFSDNTTYNRNYQYDVGGMSDWFITGKDTIWYKNTFTAVANDYLSAFSTYFNASLTNYTAYIYVNDELRDTVEGSSEMGYYTIKLNELIPIYAGDNFTVSIKIHADGLASFPITEYSTYILREYPNVSFFSYDGENWIDLYDYEVNMTYYKHNYNGQLACIKAFTSPPVEIFNTTIEIAEIMNTTWRNIPIIATIKDNSSLNVTGGRVNFEINGANYTSDVIDGTASINYAFSEEGTYEINAYYYNGISYADSKTVANAIISKIQTGIIIDNQGKSRIQNGNPIIFTVLDDEGNPVKNGTLILNISGEISSYELNGDSITYELYVDEISTISIEARYSDGTSYMDSINSRDIEFTSFKTTPVIEFDGRKLNIYLLDEFEENSTGNLKMDLVLLDNEGRILKLETLELANGHGVFEYPFEPSDYTISLKFNGTDKYDASEFEKTYAIKPQTFIILNAPDNHVLSEETISVKVVDWNGNPLDGGIVGFYICNGEELIYSSHKTSDKGLSEERCTFNKTGNYTVKIDFEKENYISSEKSSNIEISRIPTAITASSPSVKPGENIHISLNINPAKADGFISVIVNGVEYGAGLYNGKAVIGISSLETGNYSAEIIYEGTEHYCDAKTSIPLYVNPYPQYEIKAKDITMDYNGGNYMEATLYNFGEVLKAASIHMSNGKSIMTNSNGLARYKINLKPGTYLFTLNYESASKQVKIVVKKAKLHFAKIDKSVRRGKYFKIRVLDKKNKAVKGLKLNIKIGKKTYKVKTDAKGYAKVRINKKQSIGKVKVRCSLQSSRYYYASAKSVNLKVKK